MEAGVKQVSWVEVRGALLSLYNCKAGLMIIKNHGKG